MVSKKGPCVFIEENSNTYIWFLLSIQITSLSWFNNQMINDMWELVIWKLGEIIVYNFWNLTRVFKRWKKLNNNWVKYLNPFLMPRPNSF
jgi:hypothetical protein